MKIRKIINLCKRTKQRIPHKEKIRNFNRCIKHEQKLEEEWITKEMKALEREKRAFNEMQEQEDAGK